MRIKFRINTASRSAVVFEPSRLDIFPRLGWVNEATPVTELSRLSNTFKTGYAGCKRDDLCSGLFGGAKVRKLDYLLASSPYPASERWATVGAIGSGHVVACCAAALKLNKKIESYLFWEPITDGILENLAYTASVADAIHYYRSRASTIAINPSLVLSDTIDKCAVIPFGATCPTGVLGVVRAGLELAEQVRNGELPEPKRIYVALGTCGTVAGLAIGVALGGLRTRIHAVTSVERIISMRFWLNKLIADTRALLINNGLKEVARIAPASVYIDRSQLGKGYGFPTSASLEAVELMKCEGIRIEPVYTGKAAAAMFHDLRRGLNEPILFWNSMRRELQKSDDTWRSKLPAKLQEKLSGE